MIRMKKLLGKKNVHFAFKISLILKGILALVEIAAGITSYFISQQFVLHLVKTVTRTELAEDPSDFLANFLLHSAQGISVSGQHFAAFYLLCHGIIKIWLIIGLWREKLAYYPASIAIFSLFIIYQVYRYSFTHSLLLLFITVLDGIVIWLTLREYQHLRSSRK
ncbi:DUF2127 domain-containing protein [Budvicia aquatica]|uniref:DUF2127 domain-containing protein n=1 Tax=Budvicia aquatica TaxID=82979 RepID=A0A2C6DHI2_9GAMM|nr:DUF2127 domain-containing protein [Budvicia aquatica]VFS50201.1 Predicted membrane protein [Budvicia aquatica]